MNERTESANPATYGVPGRSDLQRTHISVFRPETERSWDARHPFGVSRAASSAFSCRCAVPGYQTGRSDYTRGQSPETGSLSRHLAVWEPLPSVSHRVLSAGFGFTSLVFLADDAGLRTVASIGDFGWCSPGDHCPGLMRAGPAEEERRTPRYTVPVSPQCPQEIGLPTLPHMVFQGAAVSSEHTSQSRPPGNVTEPRCSPPLRGSLQQLVRLSPAGVPFQDTKLAALITPEASLERLVPLVDYLAAWKLLLSVSPWVLHTVERGYRILMGSPPPRFNGVNPTLVGPEQALVMEREVEYSLEKGGHQGGPPHESESGFYSRYFIVPKKDGGLRPILDLPFRSASVEPLSQQTEVQDAHR